MSKSPRVAEPRINPIHGILAMTFIRRVRGELPMLNAPPNSGSSSNTAPEPGRGGP